MDTMPQAPAANAPQQEIVLNSTPLPARLLQKNEAPVGKGHSKLYIASLSVVIGFFAISFVAYKLTELKPESTSAAPPMIIKKSPIKTTDSEQEASADAQRAPTGRIKQSSTQNQSSPSSELDEVNALDVGSVDADMKDVKADETLLK